MRRSEMLVRWSVPAIDQKPGSNGTATTAGSACFLALSVVAAVPVIHILAWLPEQRERERKVGRVFERHVAGGSCF